MTLVSRVVVDGATAFRVAVGAGEFEVGGVCVRVVIGAPAAFRFFDRLGATPGVNSFAPLPALLAGPPLLPATWRATSCVRFVSVALWPVEAAESAADLFFAVAEISKSMS